MFERMERVFGLETEYGITVEGAESVDVVAESIALVRCRFSLHGKFSPVPARWESKRKARRVSPVHFRFHNERISSAF
jgi:hypothetical protein